MKIFSKSGTLLLESNFANLEGANLEGADLGGADLGGANLEGANLEGANLEGAYLKGATLEGANLGGANLEGATLEGAYLGGAYLEGANLPAFVRLPEGTIYVWKKSREDYLIKLQVPEGVERVSSLVGSKCRVQKAIVISIENPQGMKRSQASSIHNSAFVYKVGETVSVPDFNNDIRIECAPGIHCFPTKEEAQRY